jgi:hypothetical protein
LRKPDFARFTQGLRTGQLADGTSSTNGRGPLSLGFQVDGNLVVYSTQTNPWRALFHTRTNGHANAVMVLQNDCNLVISDAGCPLWWAVTFPCRN